MFVPVVTKDMQLFQNGTTRNAITNARLKNVRSRAQSLEDSLNKSAAGPAKSAKISASTASVNTAARHRAAVESRQRNSRSVGALPTSASLAIRKKVVNGAANGLLLPNGVSRSPPKSKISTLDTIDETLPMTTTSTNKENENSDDASSSEYCQNNRSTPDLQRLRVRTLDQALNTSSAPGLEKNSLTTPTSAATTPSSKGGLVKWLTNTLKGNKNKEKESASQKFANGGLSNGACVDLTSNLDDGKPWKSLNSEGSVPASPLSCAGDAQQNGPCLLINS